MTDDTNIHLNIDGQAVSVPKGTTVYQAAKKIGIDIPIFCYQDRMPPFGACRMCLVEVEKFGKLQTSCTLEASDGMVVKTQSPNAVDGRKGIIEWLLINHPLDCPICDRGGECPLQENALDHGRGVSRFHEEKRRFEKRVKLGPVLTLDRERCIVCARCTRFHDILAGDHALEFIDRGYKTEVGTPGGAPAESKFIGNSIAICPVGALTSQVYRFRARPWDNAATSSACTLCPIGCNMVIDARDGEIMRTRAKDNPALNDMWMCDKGFFGYEFTSSQKRLKGPLIKKNGKLEPATYDEALDLIAKKIEEAKEAKKIAAFGGNPLTVEENFLFQKLMREGLKVNHVDHRIGSPAFSIDEEGIAPGMERPIQECEDLSFALLAGLDLTEEFPVIWLRLKQAINKGAKVIFIGHYAPEIATQIAKTVLHSPGEEIKILQELFPELKSLADGQRKGAVFVGSQYLHNKKRRIILQALSKFPNCPIHIMEAKENSLGARFAGMHPEASSDGEKGLSSLEVLKKAAEKNWDLLYIAGANPALKYPSALWSKVRSNLKFLIVQDLFLTETAKDADVVLPTLSFYEKEGSFISIDGSVQKLLPGKEIPQGLYSDGEIFTQIAKRLNLPLPIDQALIDQLQSPISVKRQSNRLNGPEAEDMVDEAQVFATFAPSLFDQGVRMRNNTHLIKLTKEAKVRIHPFEAAKRGIQDGEKILINQIEGIAKLDPRVAVKTVVVPLNLLLPAYELAEVLWNGMPVEIKKC